MSAAAKRPISAEEYLRVDREARERCDYYRGEMFAMAGASKNHNRIVRNLLVALQNHFLKTGRNCEAFASDMRVGLDAQNHYSYPDIAVVCGEAVFLDSHEDTLLNPIVVVEVLSDSTEVYDRGAKFDGYRKLASVQDYVLVSQKKPLVERFSHNARGKWELEFIDTTTPALVIGSLDFRATFEEIYFGVEFPTAEQAEGVEPR